MKRDEAVRKVRGLIRLAESTQFEAEAKSARLKAGYLMARFGLRYPEDLEDKVVPLRRPAPPPPPPATPAYPFRPNNPAPTYGFATVNSTTTGAAWGVRVVLADGQVFEWRPY